MQPVAGYTEIAHRAALVRAIAHWYRRRRILPPSRCMSRAIDEVQTEERYQRTQWLDLINPDSSMARLIRHYLRR